MEKENDMEDFIKKANKFCEYEQNQELKHLFEMGLTKLQNYIFLKKEIPNFNKFFKLMRWDLQWNPTDEWETYYNKLLELSQQYYLMLINMNIPFNRLAIPPYLFQDNESVNNKEFIEILKNNFEQHPFTQEELKQFTDLYLNGNVYIS